MTAVRNAADDYRLERSNLAWMQTTYKLMTLAKNTNKSVFIFMPFLSLSLAASDIDENLQTDLLVYEIYWRKNN